MTVVYNVFIVIVLGLYIDYIVNHCVQSVLF